MTSMVCLQSMSSRSDRHVWVAAMDTECDALEFELKTWGYCDRSVAKKASMKIYRNKFVYAAEPALGTRGTEGYRAARFKARLVCTVCDKDIARKDTYLPVICHDTLCTFLSTCAADGQHAAVPGYM